VKPIVDFVTEGSFLGVLETVPKSIIPINALSMIVQATNLFDSQLIEKKEFLKNPSVLEAIFIQSLVWSFGAPLLDLDRERFSEVLKRLSELSLVHHEGEIALGYLPGNNLSLFDYHFDSEAKQWISWESRVEKYVHNHAVPYGDILVPTSDTVRHSWVLSQFNQIRKPVLFVGEVGSSKTVTIHNFARNLSRDSNIVLNVNFSSRTSSVDIQKILESNVEKKMKDVYGPPGGKRLLVFIDDLNMPSKDKYGTQQPIAMLKLLIEKGGFYDRGKELNWKTMKDISFLSAMGTPGGGRHDVDPRFISMFALINITFPKESSLKRIFNSLVTGHFSMFSPQIQSIGETITNMTLKVQYFLRSYH
jgi:dynein heavy chain